MSTSIRCRLQLVSGDESRIGWDFKAISAIASEPERPEGGRTDSHEHGRNPARPTSPGILPLPSGARRGMRMPRCGRRFAIVSYMYACI